ncbi:hypothetical protein FNV43_RR09432 [Rhamnella rubrinervis]|uniref:Fungal lipase-type domain-containing protein n=1 Tax=Rhamnella rubrinervis TaxID=2594499 RepID=A0A8K0HAN8_9ROSA|nr:hypothetical protein FNV43_RR09432 [Rhamnella rubrinervis]
MAKTKIWSSSLSLRRDKETIAIAGNTKPTIEGNSFRGISSGRMGRMTSEEERFDLSGPLHLLTFIDWKNENTRRSILASLIQGIYVHERDRQKKRKGPQALAPPWWESFQFKLLDNLIDVDGSIFGAIYEFKPNHLLDGSPRYVIAFRGNFLKLRSFEQDINLDRYLILYKLHRAPRFEIAMLAVRKTVAAVGDSNVWLAGHSLGSAMAMLAGKSMAKTGTFLSCYLFNPPYVSFPIERIKHENVKRLIRISKSCITAGLALAMKGKNQQRNQSDDPFEALSAWFPCLYVNPRDFICCEYIGYFEDRKTMEEIGAGCMGRLATQNSIGSLLMNAMGRDTEPLHLIPSANVITNSAPSQNCFSAHRIHQWWRDDLQLQSKLYKYK